MPKLKKRPPDLHDGDDDETRALIAWLIAKKTYFVRCSRYHLKVQSLNYYIGKGTLFYDGDLAAQDERGVKAFKEHVDRLSFSRTCSGNDINLDTVFRG